jgi:putative ABC transport system permease protein
MKREAWRRYLRFWGSNIPQDVDDELRFHIEMRISEYVSRGMSPTDARRIAEERFGSVDRAREACVIIDEQHVRNEGRAEWFATIRHDVAFAVRLLRRHLLQSVVAALCLALGIGATTTMFSVANTLLLRPLPFPHGDRIVSVLSVRAGKRGSGMVSSYPDFMDWRARQHSFVDIVAIGNESFTIIQDTPSRVSGSTVSPSFFRVLGVQPEVGRFFRDDEELPGAAPVMVISHRLAESRFGGTGAAIGAQVNVGGTIRTIIGVVPDLLRYPTGTDAWTPLKRSNSARGRGNRNLEILAELRPGVTLAAARRDMAAIGEKMAVEFRDANTDVRIDVDPLRERFVGGARSGLVAMAIAAVLVLLVACTNVAGLQLARAGARAREIAVRTALGAARTRVLRQLLTESVLLSVVGGVCGIGLAVVASKTVAVSIAGSVPAWMTFELDLRALTFTLIVSMVVGIAFGVAPAVVLARLQPSDVLRGGRGSVGSNRQLLQSAFVIAQIALSVVLVIGATLAIESVVRLQNVPLGLDPHGVETFHIGLQGQRYESSAERARVIRELDSRVAAIPGVEVSSATTYAPIAGCCSQFGTQIEGRTVPPGEELMVTGNLVTPGFFRALRIPLLKGREFADGDGPDAPPVVIISATFAKQFWPAGDAIGHRIDTGGGGMGTIIGIVGDIKQARLIDPPEPQFYRPHAQDPWDRMTFTVRVRGANPGRIIPDVRRALHEIDPTLAVYGAITLEKTIDDAVSSKRLFGGLFVALAAAALFLAAAGVYAVMSFYVSQRTPELGLRMALGAERSRVIALVARRGARLATFGGIIGLSGGWLAARALSHSLYAVDASEPLTYVVAAGALAAVAGLATLAPARRASAVDPMVALRAE